MKEEKYRSSLYNIVVKDFNGTDSIILNGWSLAIDTVSVDMAEMFTNSNNTINRSVFDKETEAYLLSRGYITNLSKNEEQKQFIEYVKVLHEDRRKLYGLHFEIIPTYNCNLDCFYCIQKGDDFEFKTITKGNIDQIFSHIENIISTQDPNGELSRRLELYGGEPFLKSNRVEVEYIFEKAKKLNMYITAISNITQIHYFKDLLDQISHITVTLDGAKGDHDKRRITKSGAGTFDLIINNIELLLENNVLVDIRINIDKNNYKGIKDIEKLLKRKGWDKNGCLQVYLAPIIDSIPNSNPKLDEKKLFEFGDIESYTVNTGSCIDSGYLGIKKNLNDLLFGDQDYNNLVELLKTEHCASLLNRYVFDSDGSIHACQDHSNFYKPLGNYKKGSFDLDKKELNFWHHSPVITTSEKCSICPYALFCGGGCKKQIKLSISGYNIFCKHVINNMRTALTDIVSKKLGNPRVNKSA